ncbi:TonB-dependent receptor [Bacteroidia bacterium]|nr:TonB-dependent receptor [Bacteroidia bacterium]
MKKHLLFFSFFILFSTNFIAQNNKTDANLFGHVLSDKGEHIPFINIFLKNTTVGTTTDASGHFMLKNLPEGNITIVVSGIGYKQEEQTIEVHKNQTVEVNFTLQEDALKLDEVVVTAGRNAQLRTEAPVIVSTISAEMLKNTQSIVLGEGLNYCTGLRYENDCQNCGFSQIRMNGLEGPYSQILINSRPVFSGLAGVYGLELIPANMLERIEVVRGGGSVLYGSNAIAGTVNLILQDPKRNTFDAGLTTSFVGLGKKNYNVAPDINAAFNASLVLDDYRFGIAIFGNMRQRMMFDANADGFSEIAPMKNLVIGTRLYYRPSTKNKITLDFFSINEKRDGGNKSDYPEHERDISEAVRHNMNNLALTFEQFFRTSDMFSVFASGQLLNRDSYYGANQSLSDYGKTKDRTYNVGMQYKADLPITEKIHSILITGIEHTGSYLIDQKLGYPNYDSAVIENGQIVSIPHTANTVVSNQSLNTYGAFAQYEMHISKWKFSVGGRFEHYAINDRQNADAGKNGNVFIPRATLMFDITSYLQLRAAYSRGYRAPQIFDEDLHIETSGSRKVINKNAPNLKQENSSSYTLSLDFNKNLGKISVGLLLEAFFTQLHNPFRNEIGLPDEDGVVIYTRVNDQNGAMVYGANIELKLMTQFGLAVNAGFTAQDSRYKAASNFDEKRFFRTPNNYGFITADWDFAKHFCLSLTGNYTGKMLVPYFGVDLPAGTIRDAGELRTSKPFFDAGLRFEYSLRLTDEVKIRFFTGIKNIFNAFQSDFDAGIDRDPSYIYGPSLPRTIFVGFRINNGR